MDIKQTPEGMKIIGQGEAQVVSVKKEGKSHFVRVTHPDIGVTTFIPFIQTPGLFRVPRVGDACYIFFDENFHQYPLAWGHRLSTELVAQLIGERADNITVIYSSGPKNDSITHKIELDDGEDSGVRITTGGNNKIDMKNTGDITVTHNSGSFIKVNDSSIELSIKGSTLILSDSGVSIVSAKGGKVDITDSIIEESNDGSKVEIAAGVKTTSSAGSVLEVEASIEGNAADTLSKFDKVVVSTHRHSGNIGIPTSPPFPEE